MKSFVLYWLTGDIEIVEGESLSEAFSNAGYSSGALQALDFTEEKKYASYRWDAKNKKFVKLSEYELFCARNKKPLREEIMYRARCILGFRGVKDFENVPLNITEMFVPGRQKLSDEQIAERARHIADETQYWMYGK